MIETLLNLLALGMIVFPAISLGMRLLSLTKLRLSRWETLVFSTGLGLGVLAYAILLLGNVGFAYRTAAYGLLALALGVSSPQVRQLLRWTRAFLHSLPQRWRTLSWPERGLLGFLLLMVGLNLVGALAPVTGSDDMNYHLALPKIYAQTHQTGYVTTHRLSAVPFTMEMLWLLALLVRSGTLAQLLNWFLGLTLAGLLVGLGRQLASRRTGLLAATLMYSVTAVSDLSASATSELGAAVFILLAVLALLRWRAERAWRWLALAAVFAGFFGGTKLPNSLVVVLLGLAVGLYAWRTNTWRRGLQVGALFTGVALAIVSIWFVRSWFITGNPVYPYLSAIFGGRDLPTQEILVPATTTVQKSGVTGGGDPLRTPGLFFATRHPFRLLASPWTLTLDGVRYRGYPGPLFLGLLPAVMLAQRRYRSEIRFLLYLSPFLYLGWFLSYPMLRTVLPVLGLLAVPVAVEFWRFWEGGRLARAVVAGSLALWLAISLTGAAQDQLKALPVVFGQQSPADWLTWRLPQRDRNFHAFPAYQIMNQSLPPDSRVLLWESRGYYLDVDYLRLWEFFTGVADQPQLQSPGTVLDELQRWGITHVAMTEEGKRLWFREVLEATGQLNCLYEDEFMTVCEVQYPEAGSDVSPSSSEEPSMVSEAS